LVQHVETIGGSNVQVLPQGTVLSGWQMTCRQFVGGQHPITVTVWLQFVVLPQPS
jgi:hypothetical protein